MSKSHGKSTPRGLPSTGGGADEHSQLQWVLTNQNDLCGRISTVEAKLEANEKTLDRIEKLCEKIDGRMETQRVTFDKFKLKVMLVGVSVASGIAVAGWFLNGNVSKMFSELNKISELQQKEIDKNSKDKK